jgi:hypothetical protein
MSKKMGVEKVQDYFSGDIVTLEKALAIIDNKLANGCSESAFFSLYALGKIAKEHDDTKLRRDVEKRINKIVLPYKYAPYRTEGAADPVNRKPKDRPLEVPKGKHPAFNFIRNEGQDPYRLAQVVDLYQKMNNPKKKGGLGLTDADQKDFINIFTQGETSSTVKWTGTIRELHYIVYQWKFKGYILFEGADEWFISSKLFTNPKKTVNNVPTYFDADELRKAHNPKNISQDLEDVVEILNSKKPGKNYDGYVQAQEDRISYRKKNGLKGHDIFEHAFDDNESD